MTGHVDSDALRSLVERLSTLTRESGSDDERRAAELIAAELIAAGAERVRLEDERVHGTYWWPVGLPTAAAAVAGALGRLRLAVFAGALGAASVAGDIRFGPRPLRRLLPQRTTVNVVGEIGPADAPRTVVLISHHDAAHTGLIFSPTPVRVLTERFPAALERTDTGPPLMWGAVAGPLLVALGALLRRPLLRRLGTLLSAGYAAAMADIGARRVVPGANDNATGCAALAGIARVLAGDPPPGTRVILLSTGSEESFSEGMVAFGRRHFRSLPTETTTFISFDTLGSPHLLALEGEGFLGIFEYPKDLLALVATTARELGIELKPGLPHARAQTVSCRCAPATRRCRCPRSTASSSSPTTTCRQTRPSTCSGARSPTPCGCQRQSCAASARPEPSTISRAGNPSGCEPIA